MQEFHTADFSRECKEIKLKEKQHAPVRTLLVICIYEGCILWLNDGLAMYEYVVDPIQNSRLNVITRKHEKLHSSPITKFRLILIQELYKLECSFVIW